MSKNKIGRPSKIDKDTMKTANISFIIIIIIFIILLSFGVMTFFNPDMIGYIKASIANLFN